MPLDNNILKIKIKQANDAVKDMTDADAAWDKWINIVADALEAFVKSGDVVTTGSATTQTGKMT